MRQTLFLLLISRIIFLSEFENSLFGKLLKFGNRRISSFEDAEGSKEAESGGVKIEGAIEAIKKVSVEWMGVRSVGDYRAEQGVESHSIMA